MRDHTKLRAFELAMDMTFLAVNQKLWRRKRFRSLRYLGALLRSMRR